jgi:hypothetical protein
VAIKQWRLDARGWTHRRRWNAPVQTPRLWLGIPMRLAAFFTAIAAIAPFAQAIENYHPGKTD